MADSHILNQSSKVGGFRPASAEKTARTLSGRHRPSRERACHRKLPLRSIRRGDDKSPAFEGPPHRLTLPCGPARFFLLVAGTDGQTLIDALPQFLRDDYPGRAKEAPSVAEQGRRFACFEITSAAVQGHALAEPVKRALQAAPRSGSFGRIARTRWAWIDYRRFASPCSRYPGLEEFRKWTLRLTLIGSDDVVRAWKAAKLDVAATQGSGAWIEALKGWGRLLLAMRRDCGHAETQLTVSDVLAAVVNDSDQYREELDGQ